MHYVSFNSFFIVFSILSYFLSSMYNNNHENILAFKQITTLCRDCIKGLKLPQYLSRSTQGRKRVSHVLRLVYCGRYLYEGSVTTVREPQYTRYFFLPRLLRLVYSGSYIYFQSSFSESHLLKFIFKFSESDNLIYKFMAAVDEPQQMRDFFLPLLLRLRSLPWQVKFSLPKRRSSSPFIRSPLYTHQSL